jgi:hypothetical protein
VLPAALGGSSVIALGLFAGLTDLGDVLALVVIAAVTVAWAQTVSWGFATDRAWVPLTLFGAAVVAAIAAAPLAGSAGGLLGQWLDQGALKPLAGLDPDRALLLAGVFGIQLSSGNVLVRLVLAATGTLSPVRHGGEADPETRLKGGRLLGPMERVFILGLGLAGQLTEYFLVGSFVSWLVALGSLVLVR